MYFFEKVGVNTAENEPSKVPMTWGVGVPTQELRPSCRTSNEEVAA